MENKLNQIKASFNIILRHIQGYGQE